VIPVPIFRQKAEAQRDDTVSLLEELVNRDTPTEDKQLCDRFAGFLADLTRSLGLETRLDPLEEFGDSVIARRPGTAGGPRLLCVGHYDTVFPRGTANERPFRVERGVARGPGVLDMKAGIAICLQGLKVFLDSDLEPAGDLTLIFNGDEEPGSPASRVLIEHEARQHDLALIFEPADTPNTVTTRRKGVGIFTLEHRGIEAHAGAEPEKGANAIVDAAARIQSVWGLQDRAAGTTLNPGVVSGGTKPYVVPGACRIDVDVRVETREEEQRVTSALEALVSRPAVDGVRTTLTGGFHRPPLEPVDGTESHLNVLRDVADEQGFGGLGTALSGAASDGNNTAAVGTPTIDGMGAEGFGAHGPQEYIDLSSLERKVALFAGFLGRLK
jgi:glutamate carboxypeptidase